MDSAVSVLTNMVRVTSDWVTSAFEVPFARAVIFEVNIGGSLFILRMVITYLFLDFVLSIG